MSNKIVEKFIASGMSVSEFATRANLKYSTAYDIVKGKANPENIGVGVFLNIADALGVSGDELASEMFNHESAESKADNDLSYDDRELIGLFHHMDDVQQALLLAIAEEFARKP